MKMATCIVLSLVMFFSVFSVGAYSEATPQQDDYYKNEMDFHGYPVTIDAIADLDFPLSLKQIKLTGSKLSNSTILDMLHQRFDLHFDFKFIEGQNFFLRFGVNTLDDNWAYTSVPYKKEINQIYPITDPVLAALYEQCFAFLAGIGIQGNLSAGFACYFSGHDVVLPSASPVGEGNRIRILIPYTIEGLSTEYRNQIVNRNSLQSSNNTSNHILDYPFAAFAFDMQQQLIALDLACYAVEREKEMAGAPIPWQQAVSAVLDHVMQYNPSRKDLSIEEYREVYFSKYIVRVARIFPLWLPNWSNVLLPGWCVQIHLYNRETGEFALSYELAVNAITGEVCDVK